MREKERQRENQRREDSNSAQRFRDATPKSARSPQSWSLERVDDQLPGDYQFLDFVELYRKLRSLDIPFVVVGGQAVNLWASVYETEAEKLALLRPFTSRDLDIYTESQEAVTKTANALKCECILAGVDSPDVVIGALWLGELGDESPLVQFLNGTVGIKNSAPIESISKSRSPKLQRFMEHEWPVMCGQISRRREKERGKRIKSSIPPPPGA